MLNNDTVSGKQKGQGTLRNARKIYNDDVAGIITGLLKKGTEDAQLHVTCHTEYIHKINKSKSNRPFSKLERLIFLTSISSKTVCFVRKCRC